MYHYHVRWMIRRDLPEIIEMDNVTESEMLAWLRQRNVIGMVAEIDNTIVGYYIYELHKTNVTVLKLFVKKENRRGKVGTALIDKLFSKLSNNRRNFIRIKIDEYNLSAQLFLKACGFYCFGGKDQWVFERHHVEEEICNA